MTNIKNKVSLSQFCVTTFNTTPHLSHMLIFNQAFRHRYFSLQRADDLIADLELFLKYLHHIKFKWTVQCVRHV
jgi:hypothetical protein